MKQGDLAPALYCVELASFDLRRWLRWVTTTDRDRARSEAAKLIRLFGSHSVRVVAVPAVAEDMGAERRGMADQSRSNAPADAPEAST